MKNEPYVKQYENGICSNPIKDVFLNKFSNSRTRRNEFKQRKRNNTKGRVCIVSKIGETTFTRYVGRLQKIGNKAIQHLSIA